MSQSSWDGILIFLLSNISVESSDKTTIHYSKKSAIFLDEAVLWSNQEVLAQFLLSKTTTTTTSLFPRRKGYTKMIIYTTRRPPSRKKEVDYPGLNPIKFKKCKIKKILK